MESGNDIARMCATGCLATAFAVAVEEAPRIHVQFVGYRSAEAASRKLDISHFALPLRASMISVDESVPRRVDDVVDRAIAVVVNLDANVGGIECD